MEKIKLTHPADIAFAKVARGALVNGTTLPSGYKTPAANMEVVGIELVPIDLGEWQKRQRLSERIASGPLHL